VSVLITGVAGLIGSRLATWILDNTDYEVIGIDDLSGGYIENVDDRVNFYRLDLVNQVKEISNIFKSHRIKIIYHMAAYAAEGLSPFIRSFNYKNNLVASSNLINQAIENDIDRFVFTSTMAVYGESNPPPFDESMIPSPIDPYGIAKYAVEMDLACALDQFGLDYTIIRPHNVYGVNQNIWDKYRNVLGIWMYQILEGQNPTIFGDGEQRRAFSYIDDCLEPLWKSSQLDECIGEVINLGGVKEHSIKDACDIVIRATESNIMPVHLEPRHEVKNAWSTWKKSVDILGFNHTVDLEEGVSRMWKWARSQPRRGRFTWSEYEVNKGIYAFWKNE
jgi:UDP-glucose 4-epimerase